MYFNYYTIRKFIISQLKKNTDYHQLIEKTGASYQLAKSNIVTAVNTEMLKVYWEIGKHIVDFEQGGKLRIRQSTFGQSEN